VERAAGRHDLANVSMRVGKGSEERRQQMLEVGLDNGGRAACRQPAELLRRHLPASAPSASSLSITILLATAAAAATADAAHALPWPLCA